MAACLLQSFTGGTSIPGQQSSARRSAVTPPTGHPRLTQSGPPRPRALPPSPWKTLPSPRIRRGGFKFQPGRRAPLPRACSALMAPNPSGYRRPFQVVAPTPTARRPGRRGTPGEGRTGGERSAGLVAPKVLGGPGFSTASRQRHPDPEPTPRRPALTLRPHQVPQSHARAHRYPPRSARPSASPHPTQANA